MLQLHRHPLPQAIENMEQLRLFMEHHVFAVWDFMLLLKSLQQHIAPASVPWTPSRQPQLVGLINSLLAEEECDYLPAELGGPRQLSHFEIYRLSMLEVGADTGPIDAVLDHSKQHGLASSLQHPAIPEPSRRFLLTTQELIDRQEIHALAAAFAYGRERLVPDLFSHLLDRLRFLALPCPMLIWYLQRHIDLDGESHGPLAESMVLALAGADHSAQSRVDEVRAQVISDRVRFWDAIHHRLMMSGHQASQLVVV
ncbi:MAG: DUF3050 domain-containing protein [Synechococcus sp. TMED155]|jgi:hypothetical protein|nr:MAG: DUF3050 domain-containing protein [Synechococcus sp. TMED155]